MRRTVLLTAVAAVAAMATPASAAPTFTSVVGSAASYAAPAGSTTVINFNDAGTTSVAAEAARKGFTATTSGVSRIFTGNGLQSANGFNFEAPSPTDSTGYYGVGGSVNGVASRLTLLGSVANNSVSLFWGSMDNYNQVSLLDELGGTIASFTGQQIFGQPLAFPGGTGSETNRRVTFTGAPIYGISFTNTGTLGSFELDNVAFAAVPEPATWAMMVLGFGVVGFGIRRRKSVKTTVQFA